MKYLVLLTCAFAMLTLNLSCTSKDQPSTVGQKKEMTSTPNYPNHRDVSAGEFNDMINNGGVFLLDVRTKEEYDQGHIPNSANFDIKTDEFTTQISNLDKTLPILVYCHSGGRSTRAMNKMRDLGFKEVYNLTGGYSKWPYK